MSFRKFKLREPNEMLARLVKVQDEPGIVQKIYRERLLPLANTEQSPASITTSLIGAIELFAKNQPPQVFPIMLRDTDEYLAALIPDDVDVASAKEYCDAVKAQMFGAIASSA